MLIFQALSLFLSIFAFSDTLEIEEKRDTIYLDRAIYDNSLQIISGTSILKNETDYLFASGRIIFLKNVSFPLTVIYEETAEKIFYIYSKHTEEKSLAVEQVVEEKKSDSSKILIEGYKSFLVTSQGGSSALDQALDVNLKGEISSDWFIDGRIYDNTSDINSATINTPISQLENVYISLYGPKGEATLGSSSFKGFSNEFSSFSREIFGLTAYAKIKDYPVGFAAAGQKGKLSTVSFYCTDKVQGPYKLYESVFISAYSIAPESERIYLDGELLSSGEENDYTINYFTGEITFSPVRIVNERSYVYAEFQTYEELTPVSGYFLKTGQDSSGLSLLYAHEDQSVFDETARNLLYSIPSDSTSFEVSGALYAGYGKGDYILSDSIFVFAGSGNGDYSVEFFYVGYRKGDYVFSPSLSAYVYAGDGMGNYSDSKRISLPFSSDYLSLSYRKEFSFGSLSVQSSNGMYSSNRYSFDKKKSSGLSLGGEYGSKKFFVGKISSDFTIRGFSRSETYREKWGVAEIRDEPLSEILNKRSASKELGFKVNLGYEDLFKTQEYFSFLDSSRDAGFSVSSDTISGFFLSAGKRISHIVDSLVYSSGDLKAGRRFEFFDAYFFLKEKERGILKSSQAGGGTNLKIIPGKLEYSVENLFSDSLLTKKTHIARIEFLKSWSAASASIVSEYRSAYNYETQSRSDQFGLSSGASLFLGSVLTSKSTLTLTSLSAYADIDHYVYAGEGRGDYVYDENTDSYVYDDVYGSYIKLTERAVSSESGVGKRLNTDILLNYGRLEGDGRFSYDDLSRSVFSFDSLSLTSRNASIDAKISYMLLKRLILFGKTDFLSDFRKNSSSYELISSEVGIRGQDALPYSAGFIISSEEQKHSSGYYFVLSKGAEVSLQPVQENSGYVFSFFYGFFEGEYDFENYERTVFAGRTISADISATHSVFKNFTITVSPYAAYNVYHEGDSSPMAIHYKYPEGVSFSGRVSLTFSNTAVNASVSYVGEFDERYSFSQRTEANLFTYF